MENLVTPPKKISPVPTKRKVDPLDDFEATEHKNKAPTPEKAENKLCSAV
jgi:hypothetical protein